MISYAPNREDVLLDRLFPRTRPGFFIDIGARDPVHDSLTRHFHELGWTGVNVEPGAAGLARLRAARASDVNLGVGIADCPGELTLYEFHTVEAAAAPQDGSATAAEPWGPATFSAARAARLREAGMSCTERAVASMTLSELCEKHVTGTIDFLAVDDEDREAQVLGGGDWQRWRPRVVLVAVAEPPRAPRPRAAWEQILLTAGYVHAAFDGRTRFYVSAESAELAEALAVPVNSGDDVIPHEQARRVAELRAALDEARGRLSAAQALNQTLRHRQRNLPDELTRLRADYEGLQEGLTRMRARGEALAAELAAETERWRGEVAQALAAVDAAHRMLEDIGPIGHEIARRLSDLSGRHPRAAASVKVGLRRGVRIARTVRDGARRRGA